MSPEEKQKIAEDVKNFFNSLPKEVVAAHYDQASKSVTLQYKETKPKKSLHDFLEELDELVQKEMKRRAHEQNIYDLLQNSSSPGIDALLKSLFK